MKRLARPAGSSLLAPLVLLAACSGGSSHPSHPTPTPTPTPDAGVTTAPPPDAGAAGMSLAQSGIDADWMDAKADPCADFFQYACGGLLAQPIPADQGAWGAGV